MLVFQASTRGAGQREQREGPSGVRDLTWGSCMYFTPLIHFCSSILRGKFLAQVCQGETFLTITTVANITFDPQCCPVTKTQRLISQKRNQRIRIPSHLCDHPVAYSLNRKLPQCLPINRERVRNRFPGS